LNHCTAFGRNQKGTTDERRGTRISSRGRISLPSETAVTANVVRRARRARRRSSLPRAEPRPSRAEPEPRRTEPRRSGSGPRAVNPAAATPLRKPMIAPPMCKAERPEPRVPSPENSRTLRELSSFAMRISSEDVSRFRVIRVFVTIVPRFGGQREPPADRRRRPCPGRWRYATFNKGPLETRFAPAPPACAAGRVLAHSFPSR